MGGCGMFEVVEKSLVGEQSLGSIRRVRRRTCRVERARREGKARACLWISKELRLWSWTRNAAQLYFRTPEGQLSCCARVDDLSIISCPDRLFSILQFSLFSLDFRDSLILLFLFSFSLLSFSSYQFSVTMSETLQELADIPKDFLREGTLFVRRCTKRTPHHSRFDIL